MSDDERPLNSMKKRRHTSTPPEDGGDGSGGGPPDDSDSDNRGSTRCAARSDSDDHSNESAHVPSQATSSGIPAIAQKLRSMVHVSVTEAIAFLNIPFGNFEECARADVGHGPKAAGRHAVAERRLAVPGGCGALGK